MCLSKSFPFLLVDLASAEERFRPEEVKRSKLQVLVSCICKDWIPATYSLLLQVFVCPLVGEKGKAVFLKRSPDIFPSKLRLLLRQP